MKDIPDEKQIEELLKDFSPNASGRLDRHLSNAPWTPHAVARRRVIGSTIMAVLAFALLAAVTPQGRAFAQSILRYFVRAGSETIAVPASDVELMPAAPVVLETEAVPTSESGCGTMLLPRCSFDEVRALVDFPIKQVDAAPAKMRFMGATTTKQGGVLLAYQGDDGTLNLAQVPAAYDNLQQWQVGPSALVETVAIGNIPGEYVRGGWFGLGLKEAGSVSWDTETALQTLRWEEDGIHYTLWFTSAKTSDGLPNLDKSALVELAANLQAPSETASITSIPDLTLQQAEALAGFSVVEPSDMPTGFTFSNAVYSSQYNAVCMYYRYGADENYPAAVLFESNRALPTVQEIQTKAFYNGAEVEIAAEVESIPVSEAEGGAATLVTTGLQPSNLCGGEEAYANRALLWQSNGKSLVLFANLDQLDGRGFLTKLEMRHLAENLNGLSASPATETDPERMTSVEMAETFSGFDLKAPALMLADLRLDHLAYKNDGPYRTSEGETMFVLLYSGGPVGDGRTYKILVMQTINPANTLENLALAGGYEATTVNGQAAIYQSSCWDTTATGGETACRQYLTWFEDGVQYDIEVFLPASLPRETLIAIAESMR
ncbi:MAG: hypothetical protein JW963_22895 [Anaerolineales bacterium]|nr:hypothetical protein [Anaerolineales bacterium]